MKDPTHFQGEIITKLGKIHWQNHWAIFNQFLHKASLGEDSNEKTISYHKVYIFFSSLNQHYDIIICVYWCELFSQVSDVAHGPLVWNITNIKIISLCNCIVLASSNGILPSFLWTRKGSQLKDTHPILSHL